MKFLELHAQKMKVLFTYLFCILTPSFPLDRKVVFSLALRSRQKTNHRIAIEGPNVTLITDTKLPFR